MVSKSGRGSGRSGDPSRAGKPPRSRRSAPGLFKLCDELVVEAQKMLISRSDTPTLEHFDEVQLERGVEAVKAVVLLLEHDHWTFASGVARQLFEQLVNVEHIGAQPDRLVAVTRYAKFGLMQQILQHQAELEYAASTGRPVDENFRRLLRGWLDLNFEEFKGKPKRDGSPNLHQSWSGKSVRELTKSSVNGMREKQYDLLFRAWSTQVHAAPAALTDGIFGSAAVTDDLGRYNAERTAQLLATVLNLFLDLWRNLPRVEQLPLPHALGLLARMKAELVGPGGLGES